VCRASRRTSPLAVEKKRILYVEDDPDVARLTKLMLERRRPYEVKVETDSKKALGTAQGFHPDVVLLDMIMPEMDGGDVANLLRQDADLKAVPIIFLTAVAKPLQGFPFLSKPVSIEEVIACIEKHL
jgi:CheY-like chemotaxis protein